jgi:pteridine reductase
MHKPLSGKVILVTGAAVRVGRMFALACATAGADVVIHYANSKAQAQSVLREIETRGSRGWLLPCDFSQPAYAARLIENALQHVPVIHGLVNSAAIFAPLTALETSLQDWQTHLNINLTAPFLLSQQFARQLPQTERGRIVNVLDWRALRPGADHFPYTVSKAALAAMTQSLAIAFAPRITVNGLALGAILPPADNPAAGERVIAAVPAARWADENEVAQSLLFLLAGPEYITGEIIHLDGGRHLT